MRGSAALRTSVAPGGALAGPWAQNSLWTAARAVPSLDLQFASSKSLRDSATGANLITFTRASSGTFVGSDGVLRTAVTNYLLQSNQFDTTWANVNSTETAASGTAPDGTNTAWQLRDTVDASSVPHALTQSFAWVANTQYTFSVWGKAGTLDRMALIIGAGVFSNATTRSASITFSTGVTSSGGSPTSVVATQFPNGWWRLSITVTAEVSTNATVSIRTAIPGGSAYQGDGNGTILVWGAQLEQSATANEYIPTTSAINSAPRFDHNPTTGESLGLLVEEQRTNLLLNSATLSTQNVTVTAAAHTLSFTGTGTVTLTGTSTAGPLVGTGTGESNRVSLTFTPTAGTLTLTVSGTVTNAQLEVGAFRTSYIPTTTAAATRNADVANITGTNFSSWYRQDEGTVFAETQLPTGSATNTASRSIIDATDGTGNNRVSLRAILTATTTDQLTIRFGNTTVAQFSSNGTAVSSAARKIAAVYKLDDYAAWATGATSAASDTTGALPIGVNQLLLGATTGGVEYLSGTIRRLTFWPQRLNNTILETLTQ